MSCMSTAGSTAHTAHPYLHASPAASQPLQPRSPLQEQCQGPLAELQGKLTAAEALLAAEQAKVAGFEQATSECHSEKGGLGSKLQAAQEEVAALQAQLAAAQRTAATAEQQAASLKAAAEVRPPVPILSSACSLLACPAAHSHHPRHLSQHRAAPHRLFPGSELLCPLAGRPGPGRYLRLLHCRPAAAGPGC